MRRWLRRRRSGPGPLEHRFRDGLGRHRHTAVEPANVAPRKDDLRKLPEFIRLSRRVGGILEANLAFATGSRLVFAGLTFAGFASLWLAILADMGASLLVVFNGLRLLRDHDAEGAANAW